ncbi:sigma-70 family RNA polymerase sigma factor [Catellatospora tritici]|uniref:sigma-70 family RNA polymerase sigma factor n=1 Tax=Catellatospora tritici TaxID=2851566 RepID=UPI001C2D405F|nr:sigma-70 family RNA polymerase sigma factor [Catellatospora tritici]MBV1851274.1 sigma-70 family RNA polymerase sigma factor [Catellatospora tritici]
MPPTSPDDAALVSAAQAGDRRALETLLRVYLPFVYTIARRALDSDADVDDVVQDTMIRAVRELRGLRDPRTFRAWLGTIAARQVGTHLQRRRRSEPVVGTLDDLVDAPDADAPFEELTMLRLDLGAQRRQAARAARWLDGDDRLLLSLWWLEVAGRLNRTELAAAAGVSIAHAGVRVQRLRQQLEQCRALLAALDSRPRCGTLDGLVADWDGTPSSSWRKRLTRHVRGCESCGHAADELVASEQLLVGFALLPVPIALTAAVIGKGTTAAAASSVTFAAAKTGLVAQVAKAFAVAPVAAAVTGSVVVAAAVAVIAWPAPVPAPPPAGAAPQPTAAATLPTPATPSRSSGRLSPSAPPSRQPPSPAGLLAAGPVSLEAGGESGLYVTTVDGLGVLAPLSAASDSSARLQATFEVVAGLADPKCFSLRATDGRYLRHLSWRLRLDPSIDTALFRGDATFCVRPGAFTGTVLLEASNYPGWFMHRRGAQMWVDNSDGSTAFRAAGSFRIRPPLAG